MDAGMSLDNAAEIMCYCFQDLDGFVRGSSDLKSEGLLPFLSQDANVPVIRGQGLRVSSTVNGSNNRVGVGTRQAS
jgi:hypothetical protein